MRIRQNIQALLILVLLLCPCSCEKSESGNLGLYSSYKFRDLWFSDTFQFYTKDDTVFFKYEERKDHWTYVIRNDNLFIHGSLPFLR